MKSLKLAHIGLGGMGKAVLSAAEERGHLAAAKLDRDDQVNLETLGNCDVAIECTIPSACLVNLEKIFSAEKDCLMISTGWYDQMDEVKAMVKKSGRRFMFSSNYSIGVNVYFKIIEAASKLINKAEEYDVWATEIHHKNKVDSPSGTAKTLEDIMIKNIDRKTEVVEDALQRKIEDHELHFSSTRGGLINFGHTITFDSAADYIKMEHAARSRDGYALGAVKCAEWLSQQAPGFYTMDDYLNDVFK